MDTSSTIQTAVEAARVPGLSVASAVLAILVVALSTYSRRCRHPALRFVVWGASVAFIPLTSSAISALLGERKALQGCKGRPGCQEVEEGKNSREVQTMWTLLLWSVLIVVIKGNADAAAASAAAASASPSSGDVGVDGQKVRTPVELLFMYAWVACLIVMCIPEATWLGILGKAVFIVFFLLGFAKVVLKLVAFFMAGNSYAVGKNARLVSGYMAQLVEDGAEEGNGHVPPYVVVGEGMDAAAGDGKGGTDTDRVFRVLVDELWFASDFYYSPLPLCSFSGWCAVLNYILSVLIIAGAIGVGVVYHGKRVIAFRPDSGEDPAPDPASYQKAYYFITLFLLLATVLTEACEIIAGVCSNWTKMALLGHYIRFRSGTPGRCTDAALERVLRLRPAKRWSDKIGQNSVLEPRRFGKRSGLFSEKLYGRAGLMRSVEVSPAVKDAVLRSFKSSYGGLDKGSTPAAHLVGLGGKVDSWAWPAIGAGSGTSSTTEHILACHIGTRLFEIKYSHAAYPASAAADMTAACHLSYYCAYLVAATPGLLPDSPAWTDKRYKEVVADVKAALGKDDDGASESTTQRYERLRKELSATTRDEVLQRGAELGSRLVEAYPEDEAAAWRFLADFWSEMVLFVAPSKNVKGHVEAMGRGGEFVTLVWALLLHAGVTDRPGTADGSGVP
ncbi:unnamed protein product [Triticum turgidum subsp. durum]|uniref:DUF4220 domain-containing protein n=1 Tax=Triticum turgidum subsp. durum TaxID=4567 RepID=A0A9R1RHH8_TRITD|nr:unnamed protein product [Triticum turgidum subsp. durum]